MKNKHEGAKTLKKQTRRNKNTKEQKHKGTKTRKDGKEGLLFYLNRCAAVEDDDESYAETAHHWHAEPGSDANVSRPVHP